MRCAIAGLGLAATLAATEVRADVVTEWNTVYLNTVRVVGGPPCPLARAAAMMHVAMFDALESIDHRYTPLIVKDYAAPVNANRKAAIASAAHDVLVSLYPARAAVFDAALNSSLAQIPAGPSRDAGVAAGSEVAARVVADHSDDQPFMTDTNYVYGTGPGAYQPTFPDFTTPPFSPGWGHCKPWCMVSGDQFRPKRGPLGYTVMSQLITSSRYAEQFREVMNYGKRQSTVRTADQTELAWFWANDRNGTYKPAGHLNYIAQIVSVQQGLNLEQNARLFAMLNVAMGDAGIVAWDGKYMTDIDLWRPITAIRNADTDGNPLTKANKNWVPLLDFSPPFPGYISGHATFGGAWAATMKAFFGTDNITFSATSDEPASAGVVRTFRSFSEAGYEDAISRIYLGVHFRMDAEDGFQQGYLMGTSMANNFFERTCRADVSNDGSITSADMTAFTNAYFAGQRLADFNRDGHVNSADAVDFMNAYLDGCSAQ
jgi:hypothetical protein